MMKERLFMFVGLGILILGLMGSVSQQSNPSLVEPTNPPSSSATTGTVHQDPTVSPLHSDEPIVLDNAAPNQVDASKEIDFPESPLEVEESKQEVSDQVPLTTNKPMPSTSYSFSLKAVPTYNGSAYATINGNVPFFSEEDLTTNSFESYSKLDNLGRCGVAYACVGQDIMPTEERGSIGMIRPSGWETIRYDDLIEDRYLYNRCHLLGYQLTGENTNEQNLITGTRYMNIQGMLPFENQVASYVKSTNNHVLLRVTPVFDGDNLLANGVLMEAKSVEDNGKGVSFCVFAYNVQPGIRIDYSTGASERESSDAENNTSSETPELSKETEKNTTPVNTEEQTIETPQPVIEQKGQVTNGEVSYIGNKNTKKFHYPSCPSVSDMKEKNKVYFEGTREEAINKGYTPCKRCSP